MSSLLSKDQQANLSTVRLALDKFGTKVNDQVHTFLKDAGLCGTMSFKVQFVVELHAFLWLSDQSLTQRIYVEIPKQLSHGGNFSKYRRVAEFCITLF